MLSGIYAPESGCIFVDGNLAELKSPKDAIALGIGMVQQHFKLVEVMSAAENITAGQQEPFFANKKQRREKIEALCAQYGFSIAPDKLVHDMSVAEKQTVEILKVLYRGARILILDEPTAVLSPQESDRLFEVLANMKKNGCAVILITHKLSEVMAAADRITVIRRGETVETVDKAGTNAHALTELMMGRAVSLEIDRPACEQKTDVFKIRGLTVKNAEGVKALNDVTFSVSGGEIFGIAGVGGSGQKEFCEAVAGLVPVHSGDIVYEDSSLTHCTPREILKKGVSMSFIPEDRLGMGLVGSMNMVDNLMLKDYQNTKGPFLNRKIPTALALKLIDKLAISTPGIKTPIRQLSGGNIQKVLVGRELSEELHVLVTAYPVRGLDVNTAYTIYDMLNAQKKKGVAVIFVGEDLDVLMELCDRIGVFYAGKLAGIVDPREVTKEQVGLMMTGM